MSGQRTYLEFSEEGGGSHKFYEVVVEGKKVTIRYGRIGEAGQSAIKSYKSPDEAQNEAQKQILAKKKKGYEEAVQGQRQRRSVSRRPLDQVKQAAKGTTRAPVLWRFHANPGAFGIFVDAELCWVGDDEGQITAVDHQGQVIRQMKLPDCVMCLVRDDQWLYCGCDDGNVYDLSGEQPFVAYEISDSVNILWLDIHDGSLCVSDDDGTVTVLDHDCDKLWDKKAEGWGWMVRCDASGIYQGHSKGVVAYDWQGKKRWAQKTRGGVMFGWQEADEVYAGTSEELVQVFTKAGQPGPSYKCDDGVFSCATAPGGKYVFAGDNASSVYCFDRAGARLWKLDTTCGTALSMQYFRDKLYIVTTEGVLACIDVSEAAIAEARTGKVPEARIVKAAKDMKIAAVGQALPAAAKGDQGVLVECVDEGGKIRVRPLSPGYETSRNVQFPRDIRRPGTRYLVDGLVAAGSGGFYRVKGQIRQAPKEPGSAAGPIVATAVPAKKAVKKAAKKTAKKAVKKAAKKTAKKVSRA